MSPGTGKALPPFGGLELTLKSPQMLERALVGHFLLPSALQYFHPTCAFELQTLLPSSIRATCPVGWR